MSDVLLFHLQNTYGVNAYFPNARWFDYYVVSNFKTEYSYIIILVNLSLCKC